MSQKTEMFGKYILLEKLAMGGMAEVYLAKAPSAGGISKFIAIKRILPQFSENKEFISMFKDEAKIAINLNHSNIVSIFEFGDEREGFYLAMDYVEGRNLRQILNKLKKSPQRLSTEQCLYIIKEVAAGLDNAHRCLDGATGRPLNIIHRDMSPQNVMVSFEGEVKVVDFGIAKAESQIETTRAGTLKGKFGYMSPEQVEGQNVDLRTDIFSLGIVLWELLANDRLFVANNEINTLRKIRDCQIPSLRKINPNIPQELDRIVNKALARDRNLRYQTSAAFHKDLNRFLNRQYPDFSAQDFSVFIKTLFANEILETRKRLIEYSKIRFNSSQSKSSAPSHSFDDRTEVTATLTATDSPNEMLATPKSKPEPANINFNEIKVNKREIIRKNVELKNTNEKALTTEVPETSQPSIQTGSISTGGFSQPTFSGHTGTSSATSLTSPGFEDNKLKRNIAAAVAIGAAALYLIKPAFLFGGKAELTSQEPVAEVQARPKKVSKKETFSLMVTSKPSKAEIYVNGKNTGIVTPGKVRVPQKKAFDLEVRRPGFITYRERFKVLRDGQRVPVPLQRELVGYLDIDVSPRTAIIYVNGEKLHRSPPVKRYAVPAGTRVTIQAVNPFSSTEAQQSVTVGRDRTRKVMLKLKAKQSNSPRQPSGRRRSR